MNFEEFKKDFDEKIGKMTPDELVASLRAAGVRISDPICLARVAEGLSDLTNHEMTERTMNEMAPPGCKWHFNPKDPDRITGWWVPKCCNPEWNGQYS
jgi:hypothetical protein